MVFFGNPKYLSKGQKIERMKKWMNRIAYGSLLLDITIAIITLLTIWQIGNPKTILAPVEYMLTIVVVLSVGLGSLIILLEHYEKIIVGMLIIRKPFHAVKNILRNQKYNYNNERNLSKIYRFLRKRR